MDAKENKVKLCENVHLYNDSFFNFFFYCRYFTDSVPTSVCIRSTGYSLLLTHFKVILLIFFIMYFLLIFGCS